MVHLNSAIVQEFLIESLEALLSINDELTNYEKNPDDQELLNSIFRKVHTLKGSSSFLGLKKLQEITHSAESILDLIREGSIGLNAEMIDVFFECFDSCIELLRSIEETGKENNKDYSSIVGKFSNILEKNTSSALGMVGSGAKIYNELLNQDIPEVYNKPEVQNPMEKTKVKIETKDTHVLSPINTSESVSDHDSSHESSAVKSSGLSDSVVRVNVQLLDKIMNVVGELVLNRNQILQYANIVDSSDLNRLAQQLNIITTELQTDIMTTRMQPVGSVLSKFERIVRDLAR
ncbi:MAG: Hpt domain-containing protein, partial [Bacteriovorax sp.]|nr:Hpt domain-containing protein [Bacteriovorax sp.]